MLQARIALLLRVRMLGRDKPTAVAEEGKVEAKCVFQSKFV